MIIDNSLDHASAVNFRENGENMIPEGLLILSTSNTGHHNHLSFFGIVFLNGVIRNIVNPKY